MLSLRSNALRSTYALKVLGIWIVIFYLFWATRHLWRRNQQAENVVHSDVGHQPDLIATDSKGWSADEAQVYNPVETSSSLTTIESPPAQEATHLPDKVVVVGKVDAEDTTWIDNELSDWQHAIYSVDNTSAPLHTPANKGKEVMPYLSYIVDNYENLPSTIAFVHAHRDGYPQAWHTDSPGHSNVISLQRLQTDFVQSNGYVNLRCIHSPGCPSGLQPFRDPPGPEDDPKTETEALMHKIWPELFPNQEMPSSFGVACCAQFAVSRDRVRERPLAEYARWRQWLLDTELIDVKSGGIMEYMWHVIFGMEAEYCPPYLECRCNVYGEC